MSTFETPVALQGRAVPPDCRLVGYSALVHAYGVDAPLRNVSCIGGRIREGRRRNGEWTEFDKRMAPDETLAGHLVFALRHETLDLLVLKRIFVHVPTAEMVAAIEPNMSGVWLRRAWYLWEWLMGETLSLPDLSPRSGGYVDVLDGSIYFTGKPEASARHRVRGNLLGVSSFCPVVLRSHALADDVSDVLALEADQIVGSTDRRLLSRAVSVMLLKDSQANFAIEGVRLPQNKAERFCRAVAQAGKVPFSQSELLRLQTIILDGPPLGGSLGFRTEGVFIGDRHYDLSPNPDFIGAKPEDIQNLMNALEAAHHRMAESGVPPIVHAAIIAYGLVMIHPFCDGNGRIHRFLVHQILAERGFASPDIIFPVSTAILRRVEDYKRGLESHSGPLLDYIRWRQTPRHNVDVINDTSDLYRYFDATRFAEFLTECVQSTIRVELVEEIRVLAQYDQAKAVAIEAMDIQDNELSLLIHIISENGGMLSKSKRKRLFSYLSDEDVVRIEGIVRSAYGLEGFQPTEGLESHTGIMSAHQLLAETMKNFKEE